MLAMMILVSQFALVASLAAWILTGVYDNLRHPALNEAAVAMVVRFDLLADEFPAEYAEVKARKIDDPTTIRFLYRAIVLWEIFASLVLIAGALALLGGLLGAADVELARGLAMLGALLFTLTWVGFLVGGNYFCYWYCHQGTQATHFFLTLWGVLVIVLLALPL